MSDICDLHKDYRASYWCYGYVFHTYVNTSVRYVSVTIDGEEKEFTCFKGTFQNMLTEHYDVQCIGVIQGHYEIKQYDGFNAYGFTVSDDELQTYILGIRYITGLDIPEENRNLDAETLRKFIEQFKDIPVDWE